MDHPGEHEPPFCLSETPFETIQQKQPGGSCTSVALGARFSAENDLQPCGTSGTMGL